MLVLSPIPPIKVINNNTGALVHAISPINRGWNDPRSVAIDTANDTFYVLERGNNRIIAL